MYCLYGAMLAILHAIIVVPTVLWKSSITIRLYTASAQLCCS
jgi:hypothetical protein